MPDYLRLAAVFGIGVVNVQFMAFSIFVESIPVPASLDVVAIWLVNGLAMLKTYGLFSFMFGAGLGFMMRAAEIRGLRLGRLYRNRMLGLALLGVLHGCLFFPGDILVVYAVIGSLLYCVRGFTVRRLVHLGAALLLLQILIAVPLMAPMGDDPQLDEILAYEQYFMSSGTLVDVLLWRAGTFLVLGPVLLGFQGVAALGWFCLGFAAVKSGLIADRQHPVWGKARYFCLGPGVVFSLLGAGLFVRGAEWQGLALIEVAAPLATAGYLGLIAWLSRPPGPFMAHVLSAGGSSLSVYLGQSIILSSIFSPYGLGLWGQVSVAAAVGIAVLTTMALIAALCVWHRYAQRGPFEWVLRRITYARQPHL